MTVTFSSAWTLHGLQALLLENDQLRVTILPELGGKIWSIVSKPHNQEMLWHHPHLKPRPAHHGATYDNWFCGGWDEVFPNDFPVEINGEAYPDHGEIWSMPAEWHLLQNTGEEVTIALEHRGIVIPTRFRKLVTLRAGEAALHLTYTISNDGPHPLDLHWKTHPALPVAPGATIHLPARTVLDEPGFGEVFREREFAWSHATRQSGEPLDLRHLPAPDSGEVWFFYGNDLTEGSTAITYGPDRPGFGLTFDPAVLDSVWVFGAWGGWRNLNAVILEPCTGYPADLGQAIATGSALHLAAGETITTSLTATILPPGYPPAAP